MSTNREFLLFEGVIRVRFEPGNIYIEVLDPHADPELIKALRQATWNVITEELDTTAPQVN